MTTHTMYLTATRLEQAVGLEAGSIEPIAFLVIQELAKGLSAEDIAKGLGVSEEELNGIASATVADSKGLVAEQWLACVTLVRATEAMNQNTVEAGWDALEAMAVNRLADLVHSSGSTMNVKDAVAIANMANKATRRGRGEGKAGNTSISVMNRQQPGGGSDMSLELKGGHIGSIRLSLSARIQEQLTTPRTIEGRVTDRKMLSLDEAREVVNAK